MGAIHNHNTPEGQPLGSKTNDCCHDHLDETVWRRIGKTNPLLRSTQRWERGIGWTGLVLARCLIALFNFLSVVISMSVAVFMMFLLLPLAVYFGIASGLRRGEWVAPSNIVNERLLK